MVRGILFDVGGVIIRDNSLFVKQSLQKDLGVNGTTLEAIWKTLVPLLGSGVIDEAAFWQQAAKEYDTRLVLPSEDLFGKPFRQTLQPFTKVLDAVRELGDQGTRCVVLSNTIEAHAKILRQAGVYDGFDDVLLSYETGLRKPSAEIFNLALSRTGLKAEEAIFLDDQKENIEAAKGCGIRTIFAIDEDQIVRDIRATLGLR